MSLFTKNIFIKTKSFYMAVFKCMNISKYAGFFHDGSIIDIQHRGDKIKFSMASAEMNEEDVKDDITLSKDDSIQGKLHVEGIKNIIINGKSFFGILKKTYDDGKILDFEITKNSVELSITWRNYSPKSKVDEFLAIKIIAKKIWWENIPNLEDFY